MNDKPKFKILIDKKSISETSFGAIFSEIYFNINGEFFPEKNWCDFSLRIISWLAQNIEALYQGTDDLLEVCFMHGVVA